MSSVRAVVPHGVGGQIARMVRWPTPRGGSASAIVVAARRARPLLGYWVTLSVGWRLAPLTLTFALVVAVRGRGRPWAGDWVWGLTFAGEHVLFTSAAVAAVAAYDAGSAFAGPAAAAWDSVSRRGSDVVRIWLGSLAPFLLVHLFTVLVVVALLFSDGAAYGQTLAPLAQQISILALSGAIGVVGGVVGGARLGAFAATVATLYVVYIRGYMNRGIVPAQLDLPDLMLGQKLSEPLVAVQVVGAGLWIALLLGVAATSRWRGTGGRRPRTIALVLSAVVIVALGPAAQQITAGWVARPTTDVPRICSTQQAVTACLYQGHDGQLGTVLAILGPAHATAVHYGVGDLVPTQVVEVHQGTERTGGFGEIFFGAGDTSRRISHRNLLDAVVPGKQCPALITDLPVAAAFDHRAALVRQTMDDLAKGSPPARWHLPPNQLRTFITNARHCDVGAAVAR